VRCISKDAKEISEFAPRSWRNTCCKHGRRRVMVMLSIGVSPRARCKFWISFASFERDATKREPEDYSFMQRLHCAEACFSEISVPMMTLQIRVFQRATPT